MRLQFIPAAQQASVLFHQQMRVAWFARQIPPDNKDANNVAQFYLNSLDRKIQTLRGKLGIKT